MNELFRRWCARIALALVAALAVVSWSSPARAYAGMIRHEYTSCAQCHADPSGGGLLTPYGRAQGEILLRSHYGAVAEDEEPGKLAEFAFGVVPLPEQLLLGADYRLAYLSTRFSGTTTSRFIQMQADLEGQLTVDRFRAAGSIGYDHSGAQAAAITQRALDNVVSRVHWAGMDLGEDRQFLLRAGRMNLPYGVRSVEHTMFIHSDTHTDLNAAQQHGVALAYNGAGLRAEGMVVLGNYQVSPDAYRERGYSGYVEWAPSIRAAVGASSLLTYASRGFYTFPRASTLRQAHGVFGRVVLVKPLVLLAEADLLVSSYPGTDAKTNAGYATMVQGDLEVWQGLHFMLTGELANPTPSTASTSLGGWASAAWFFAPHADLRTDLIFQQLGNAPGPVAVALPSAVSAFTFLTQIHVYL